ncbi:MAG: hypothetical protein JST82_06045 [Bacteroidetes bacterium]|nr:hypothetical protein [Bacteroidota bacterium]
MIRLRAFRAIDELETCQKFVEGHIKILKVFGITMITSAKVEWFNDPNTYVIVAETPDSNRVLGGARVQIGGGKYPLPIEDAVKAHDDSIHDVVNEYSKHGTAELCGLWNSREIAGMGIGSTFLTRTAVAIAPQLKLNSMFALCAAYTIGMAERAGFQIATFLGNNGTFYYPKEDLVATAMLLKDVDILSTAHPDEKAEILSLRENPKQTKTEEGRRSSFELIYDLEIHNRP